MKLVSTLLLLLATSFLQSGECQCKKVPDDVTTHQGHESVLLADEEKVSVLRGEVVDPSEASLPETLVEVFGDPDVLLLPNNPDIESRKEKRRRVAACRTGEDGKFCFSDLRGGRYELRFSREGFNTVSVVVSVNAHHQASEGIKMPMPLAY